MARQARMGWVLGGLGLVLMVAAFLIYRDTAAFVARAEGALGRIDSYSREESITDGKRSVTYYPVVVFTAKDGSAHSFRGENGSSRPGASGELVEVLYDPKAPHDARTNGFFSLWLMPVAVGAIGLVFALAGLSVARG